MGKLPSENIKSIGKNRQKQQNTKKTNKTKKKTNLIGDPTILMVLFFVFWFVSFCFVFGKTNRSDMVSFI
jgi:hypothetical protein